jgi:hypothetical protein
MSSLLASDDNNPDFVGVKDPDGALTVRFFTQPIKNEFKSTVEQRPIFEDVDMISIIVPGSIQNDVVAAVREEHKMRFPRQWAHFQNKTAGDAREIGTPLSQWPRLTLAQVEELRALKFFTVESVAHASDQRIATIGMLAGISHFAFREAAQRFLRVANDNAALQKAEEQAKATEEKLNAEKSAREAMEVKLAEMQATIASLTVPVKKKPGRPKKVVNVE